MRLVLILKFTLKVPGNTKSRVYVDDKESEKRGVVVELGVGRPRWLGYLFDLHRHEGDLGYRYVTHPSQLIRT